MQSVTYRNHPDEVAALQAELATVEDERHVIPNYHCYGCGQETAYYLNDDNHWYTPCFQCDCGWWEKAAAYEDRIIALFGLEEVA